MRSLTLGLYTVPNWPNVHRPEVFTMTVYVLIREDRNDHGYIDTSITGVFLAPETARRYESEARASALADGFRLDDDEGSVEDWEVSWKVEAHELE
jgi:hypothetical protein